MTFSKILESAAVIEIGLQLSGSSISPFLVGVFEETPESYSG